MDNTEKIFTNRYLIVLFAMIAVFAWSCAFPFIKIGFSQFGISSADTWSKALFAGIRFFFAGILLIVFARLRGIKQERISGNTLMWLLLFGLVNTALHYFFFYLGVSYSTGSRSAIYESLSTFMLIVLACVFFESDKMNLSKLVGCLCGLAGIILLNHGDSGTSGGFSMPGDMFMIINSVCSAFGGILTRVVTRKMNPVYATGYSLAFGGFLLTATGYAMGGHFEKVTAYGIVVLIILILISSVGFALYNQLICYNPVGRISIYNSLIPILGAVMSCILLKEQFMVKYILAALLAAAGVYIVNSGILNKKERRTNG
jgi:drug/metabolite transporter (DMT)-like permease